MNARCSKTECMQGWTGWIYEGVLVDLELATVYQYQVGFEGGEWSDVMEFRTQPQSPAPSKNVIAVFGDMGTSTQRERRER